MGEKFFYTLEKSSLQTRKAPPEGRVLAVVATPRIFGSCNDRVVFNERSQPEEIHAGAEG